MSYKSKVNRIVLLSLLILTVCLVVTLSVNTAPPPLPAAFNPVLPTRAKLYLHSEYLLSALSVLWYPAGLWLLFITTPGRRIGQFANSRSRYIPGSITAYALYSLIIVLWMLPFSAAFHLLELHFGFSRETWGMVAYDHILNWLMGLPEALLFWIAVLFYRKAPARFWIWIWLAIIPLMYVETALSPVLIEPLFNTFTPLPAGGLRNGIEALASRAHINHAEILIENTSIRSTHVNAYVAGFGPTARIVIDDNDLRLLPQDEILAMVGHEMGHYVEGHVYIKFISSVVGSLLILWLISRLVVWLKPRLLLLGYPDITDPQCIPLLLLLLFIIIQAQMPVANIESRYLEHRADAFGLRLTHLDVPMAKLMMGFVERDYADPYPPRLWQFWYGTHPSLDNRILFALQNR